MVTPIIFPDNKFDGFTDVDHINDVTMNTGIYNNAFSKSNNNNKKHVHFGRLGRELVRAKRRNELQKKVSTKESNLPAPKEEEEFEDDGEKVEIAIGTVVEKGDDIENHTKIKEEIFVTKNNIVIPSILKSTSIHPTIINKPDITTIKCAVVDFNEFDSQKALNDFEETQRKLELFNSERKEQLRRALTDRAKKTHEEVKKLNQIEEELKKLDQYLSNDVGIIRNQIELASHDFMEAQKRFNKAEKEYVEAKLELFNKKEKKELLTSHLCSIIEQNELRKAKKLSDLMEKLEVPSKPLPMEELKIEEMKDKMANQSADNTYS